MNKKLIWACALVPVAFALPFYLKGSQNATLNRPIFDHLDKRNLKKAYNAMFRDAISGKIDIEGKSEAELVAMLIERYDQMGFN